MPVNSHSTEETTMTLSDLKHLFESTDKDSDEDSESDINEDVERSEASEHDSQRIGQSHHEFTLSQETSTDTERPGTSSDENQQSTKLVFTDNLSIPHSERPGSSVTINMQGIALQTGMECSDEPHLVPDVSDDIQVNLERPSTSTMVNKQCVETENETDHDKRGFLNCGINMDIEKPETSSRLSIMNQTNMEPTLDREHYGQLDLNQLQRAKIETKGTASVCKQKHECIEFELSRANSQKHLLNVVPQMGLERPCTSSLVCQPTLECQSNNETQVTLAELQFPSSTLIDSSAQPVERLFVESMSPAETVIPIVGSDRPADVGKVSVEDSKLNKESLSNILSKTDQGNQEMTESKHTCNSDK